jgi:hypothetical protein
MARADQEAWAPTLAIPREEKPLQDTDPTKALYRMLAAKLLSWAIMAVCCTPTTPAIRGKNLSA